MDDRHEQIEALKETLRQIDHGDIEGYDEETLKAYRREAQIDLNRLRGEVDR